MKQSKLKWVRVIVSLLFLIFTGFIFLDFSELFSSELISGITWLQFAPSVLNFITLLSYTALGFLIVLILTFLFGRIYCSSICPLGTLQDVITHIFRKKKIRKTYRYHRPSNILRYSLLALTVLLFTFGSVVLINLLDPFSNFGKIVSNLFRPVYMAGNNALSWLFIQFNDYSIAPVEIKGFHVFSMAYSVLFFGVVSWMATKRGRLFCNTVCPVGSLLGLCSKNSLVKIQLDQEKCNSCGICAMACKAECIDAKNRTVDMSRCVACFNCLSACKSNGVLYSAKGQKESGQLTENVSHNRRFILSGLAGSMLVFPGLSALAQQRRGRGRGQGKGRGFGRGRHKEPTPVVRNYPVSPPGSLSLEHFNDTCTACHLCVSACPTHVLVPAFTEYGLKGIMQPRMDYAVSFCNFDCHHCSQVCPTGAIKPISLDAKQEVQIGKVHFIQHNCIVITEKTECGACSEHCPTKAVDMKIHRNGLYLPFLTPELCVGCGACEYACPTDPLAIYVDGNPVHEKAEKPKVEKIDKEIDHEADFPF